MSLLKYSFGLLAIAGAGFVQAASFQIDYSNLNNPVLGFNNLALTPGPSSTPGNSVGDGAVIQIGYFTTTTDTFTGTWVPITGAGSANTLLLTSIGDGGDNAATSAGIFTGSVVFDNALAATSSNLPPSGAQLAIRFFNGTTVEGSTHYNTVTSTSWNFGTLTTPLGIPEVLDLDSSLLKWEDAANTFKTSLAIIPEPSTALLGAIGALGLLRRRR